MDWIPPTGFRVNQISLTLNSEVCSCKTSKSQGLSLSFNSSQLSMWAQFFMLAFIFLLIDSTENKTLMFTYHLPWCVAGTISVGGRSTGKWTTADTWIIFKVYDCEQRKYWKRKHKEERKKQNLFILQRLWS